MVDLTEDKEDGENLDHKRDTSPGETSNLRNENSPIVLLPHPPTKGKGNGVLWKEVELYQYFPQQPIAMTFNI
jgi:hypothetical protein